MTARMYPADPSFESKAEELFANTLREQLPDDAVMICNQRFTDRGADREADVIVAWPGHGVAVLEVKGGSVSLRDGRWWQTGGRSKAIHPVEQALKCKYALRDYLYAAPRWSRGNPRLVHLVALPTTTLPGGFVAPDAPRWALIDKTELSEAAGRIASALRQAENQPEPPTADDVELLVDCLVGTLIPQADLVAQLGEREAAVELLTRDQARLLDFLESHDRVEIRGGAGSGKTWLAVEKARRLTAEGKRVALLCYSRGLAEFLRRRVTTMLNPRHRPAYVGEFHELGIAWGAERGDDDNSPYWEQELPRQMVARASQLPDAELFDAVVIDEAQDFDQSWWPAVLAALRDPENGCLYVFSDEGQRVFMRQGQSPVPLESYDLVQNLRNTKQIGGTFSSLAKAQMKLLGGDGVPVQFVPCATDDALQVADDVAVGLLDVGWPSESVALLTTYRRHPVQVERQAAGQDAYWASYWDDEDLFYGHVLGFKGLERPAVVLAINGFRDEARAREMLYVGLSRARDLLVVCGDLELIRRVGGDAVAHRLGIQR
ncbi:NERD domain-containing protein [Klenkia brasiliensis]|uniref:PhoH-like protein n=1 Tax=Klenkia brasiliensis TaxID=333142 RepID=A0A1G7TJ93_9ACTN|nr:NERD domain-containing protein [Klenkia brasiliensis]SDG35413.1 PhoH-like protein [Klenkia brasiliensis]